MTIIEANSHWLVDIWEGFVYMHLYIIQQQQTDVGLSTSVDSYNRIFSELSQF